MTSFALPKSKRSTAEEQGDDDGKEKRRGKETEPVILDEAALLEAPSPPPSPPKLQYEKPEWSGFLHDQLYLEVLKQGTIVDTILLPQNKEFFVCGRLPTCDLPMEHASISRLHTVLQFSKDGKILCFDLESGHGTYVNKSRVPSRRYVELKNGDLIRFGESSRLYVLQGAAKTIDENKDWDADTAEGGLHKMSFVNPTKVLREWFQECGSRLTFEKITGDDDGSDIIRLRVSIPADISNIGEDIVVEATGKTRRETEDAVCSAACQRLVELGELMGEATGGDWKEWKRKRHEEDEEEKDVFYDRTAKKQKEEAVETSESLYKQRTLLLSQLGEIRTKLWDLDEEANVNKAGSGEDDELEQYMANLQRTRKTEDRMILLGEQEAILDDLKRAEAALLKLGPINLDPVMTSIPDSKRQSTTAGNEDKAEAEKERMNLPEDIAEEVEEPLPGSMESANMEQLKSKYGY